MELTLAEALQKAVEAHKEGNLQDAERLYRAILQSQPLHPDANHNLGVIAVFVDKAELSLQLFKTALEANPKIEQFWLSYIDALIKEKQFDNAKLVFEQAKKNGVAGEKVKALEEQLTLITQIPRPTLPVQKKSLTLLEKRKKLAEQTKQKKEKKQNLKAISPSESEIKSLLHNYQNGLYGDAEKSALSITQEFPKHQFGWKVLGSVLKQTGRVSESLIASQKSVQLAPQDAEAYSNLGNTLQELGRLREAEASYTQAIALKPDYAEPHNSLGFTLQELGRFQEAEASYRQAVLLNPDYAEAHYNLGNAQKGLGRLDEAEASYRQAIALEPALPGAHNNLGNTLQELGRLKEAQESYTQALALDPKSATAAQNIVKLPLGQLNLKTLDLCEKAFFGQSESVKNQASYYFSQANLLKHKGLIDQSFDEFCKANIFRWEEVGEQFEKCDRAYTDNLNRIRQWTPNVPELVEGRLTKLFLLGPSRSGKSSLENLLSKSSQVKPLYEGIRYSGLSKGFVNGKDCCEKLVFQGEDELLRQGYTVATSTDPDNIFNADYLIDMSPNTYFLIIKRDLRDVAPEIFINEYAKEQFYSYDPNGISTYLGVYNKLCAVLALKVPDRCITIRFEDIINSPEDTIERIGALVFRNFEVGRLDKYVTNFTSESLFRDHFSGINKSSKI